MIERALVLASGSPYRRQLLERLRLPFEVCVPDCDETAGPDETPGALVERLAWDKAHAVVPEWPDARIIGSDQVAEVDGQILTKPELHERARAQLRLCSGREVTFHTGLCVLDSASGHAMTARDVCVIRFRPLTDEEIERYLEAEAPYDCAGSIRSEGYAVTLFESIRGDDPNALIGLPLIRLAALLRAHGVPLP